MKDFEKQIEDAALKAGVGHSETQAKEISYHFINGAKSPQAKEYWQEGMYSKEDLNEAFRTGYSKAVSSINEARFDRDDNAPTFEQWFNFYKKK
jgi:hypothetical protein